MNWLDGLRVLELAGSLDGAVCGRALADAGADVRVLRVDLGEPPDEDALLRPILNLPKRTVSGDLGAPVAESALIVVGGHPDGMEKQQLTPDRLAQLNPAAIIVSITPFGLEGPRSRWRGSDLVTFHAGGLGRILLGPVEDPEGDPPVRAVGQQSAMVAGLTGALAATIALGQQRRNEAGARIDISAEEAVATMAARELAMPSFGGVPSRTRTPGQIGLTYVIPASDGYVAISPREAHQWRSWLEVMGEPSWAHEPEMQSREARMQHGDRLIQHMAPWSSQHTRAELFALAQEAHVPCFPVNQPSDVLDHEQFEHRAFLIPAELPGPGRLRVPGRPYRVYAGPPAEMSAAGPPAPALAGLPLEGVRVVDLSWVIAGPTSTRFLASMGAEVIKVESPARPDPGRGSPLHAVLGQSKRSLALDLKAPGALDALRRVIAASDVVVENFAAGVMERFGLDYDSLRELRPDIIMLSASGVGRSGPLARTVAYGTLLQAFTGFAALNTPSDRQPVTGFAWADPLSGMIMATSIAAALHARQRTGAGCHIDFSMSEALLWTLPGVIARAQIGGEETASGNASPRFAPHGLYRAGGDDEWLALAVTDDEAWRTLCGVVDELASLRDLDEVARHQRSAAIDDILAGWVRRHSAAEAAAGLQAAGVAAASSANTQHLFEDRHLEERGFYTIVESGDEPLRLPGLPWRWHGVSPRLEAAPALGSGSDDVLRDVAGLTAAEIARLRETGALG